MNIFKRAAIRMDATNKLKEIAEYTKITKLGNVWAVGIIDPKNRFLFDVEFCDTDEGKKLSKYVSDVLHSIFSDVEMGAVQWTGSGSKRYAAAYRIPVAGKNASNLKNLAKLEAMQQEFAQLRLAQRATNKQR